MALSLKITASGPATIATELGPVTTAPMSVTFDCIARVTSVSGGKSGCDIVCSFADTVSGISFVRCYGFVPSVADGSTNFIRQAYIHLKSLPEFSGAMDC
jgi:hypothetical protein